MTLAPSFALAQAKKTSPAADPFGRVERLDPRFDKICPDGTQMEKLDAGFAWTEGPVWARRLGGLLFSDIPNNSIMFWKEGLKQSNVFLDKSGYTGSNPFTGSEPGTNGLAIDSKGRLVMCCHGDRQVVRIEEVSLERTVLASKYRGRRLNSPNDLVFKSNGDLYFTDPPYGLPKGADDPGRELDFCGVYRLFQGGELTLLTEEMTRPNGIAFSPDEKTLYVAQSDPHAAIWKAFPVKDDGSLGEGKVFYDATKWVGKRPGLPDGMKVDQDGNIFATGPGGVLVFDPDGTLLGRFDTGEKTANCGWGDDGSTLYICADMYICRIRLATKGLGF
jgi:gluconolactonase